MMELKARLLEKFGKVLRHVSRSTEYVGVEYKEIKWRSRVYTCVWVDGMLCTIDTEEA